MTVTCSTHAINEFITTYRSIISFDLPLPVGCHMKKPAFNRHTTRNKNQLRPVFFDYLHNTIIYFNALQMVVVGGQRTAIRLNVKITNISMATFAAHNMHFVHFHSYITSNYSRFWISTVSPLSYFKTANFMPHCANTISTRPKRK